MAPNHGVSLKTYTAFPLVEFDEAGGNLEKASPRDHGHTHEFLYQLPNGDASADVLAL